MATMQKWDLWYPQAGATGLPFARCSIDPATVLWVHAAPDTLSVAVYEGDRVVARGEDLQHTGADLPTARLWITGDKVLREDRFPTDADIGSLIVLPGGEAGRLTGWWNAEDGSEWRWQVEFYNHR